MDKMCPVLEEQEQEHDCDCEYCHRRGDIIRESRMCGRKLMQQTGVDGVVYLWCQTHGPIKKYETV